MDALYKQYGTIGRDGIYQFTAGGPVPRACFAMRPSREAIGQAMAEFRLASRKDRLEAEPRKAEPRKDERSGLVRIARGGIDSVRVMKDQRK